MSEPNVSAESPCIWCAGSLTLCGDPPCCDLCDHPYQLDQMVRAIEAAASPTPEQERTVSLDELRELSEKATPGPWQAPMDYAPEDRTVPQGTDIHAVRDSGPNWPGFFLGAVESKPDAAFIVAAVNYVRAALAQRDREEET